MTLDEQLDELHKVHTRDEHIDPTILLRVLDSMNESLEAQQKQMVEFGGTLEVIVEKLDTLAKKVSYQDPR